MEFLITGRHMAVGLPRTEIGGILEENAFGGGPVSTLETEDFAVHVIGGPAEGPLFDGYAFGRELFHPRYNPPGPEDAGDLLKTLPERSGGFVVGTVDPRAMEFTVATDVLGQYALFCYRPNADRFAV